MILKIRREDYDNKAESLFKRACHDNGSDFPDGKASMNPGLTQAVSEALDARELIKISVLNNCMDDPRELAETLAQRTRSEVVQVIGKKIVLYREGKDDKKKIILP